MDPVSIISYKNLQGQKLYYILKCGNVLFKMEMEKCGKTRQEQSYCSFDNPVKQYCRHPLLDQDCSGSTNFQEGR